MPSWVKRLVSFSFLRRKPAQTIEAKPVAKAASAKPVAEKPRLKPMSQEKFGEIKDALAEIKLGLGSVIPESRTEALNKLAKRCAELKTFSGTENRLGQIAQAISRKLILRPSNGKQALVLPLSDESCAAARVLGEIGTPEARHALENVLKLLPEVHRDEKGQLVRSPLTSIHSIIRTELGLPPLK